MALGKHISSALLTVAEEEPRGNSSEGQGDSGQGRYGRAEQSCRVLPGLSLG